MRPVGPSLLPATPTNTAPPQGADWTQHSWCSHMPPAGATRLARGLLSSPAHAQSPPPSRLVTSTRHTGESLPLPPRGTQRTLTAWERSLPGWGHTSPQEGKEALWGICGSARGLSQEVGRIRGPGGPQSLHFSFSPVLGSFLAFQEN